MAGPFGHIRASKGGAVQMNGTPMSQVDWRGTWRGEDVDTSNFQALGFDQGTIGFQVFEATSAGVWNAAVNAMDSPPGIYPTDLHPNDYYYINVSDNTFWFLPFARILTAENSTGNLKSGAISFNWTTKSNGIFTVPTGSH